MAPLCHPREGGGEAKFVPKSLCGLPFSAQQAPTHSSGPQLQCPILHAVFLKPGAPPSGVPQSRVPLSAPAPSLPLRPEVQCLGLLPPQPGRSGLWAGRRWRSGAWGWGGVDAEIATWWVGNLTSDSGSVRSGRVSDVRPKNAVTPLPSHPRQRVLLPGLGKEGLSLGCLDHGGGEGSGCSLSQILAFPAIGSFPAKDSRGTWQAQAATRWFGTSATAWAGSQASKTDSARPRGRLNGELILTPHTSQRWRPGFGQQLLVLEGDPGVPHPCPLDPRAGLPSRNDAASLTSRWPACHIRVSD